MRVAIYARFSSDKQSLSSLDDQVRLCRALAERNRWAVVAVHHDAAVSGALKDRKGYLSLVADALAGRFDLVVAESLDRLNRDLEETARLYKRLKFVNVGIHTVSEGPVSEVHVSISGLMGELYLKSLAEKTRRGVEGRVLAGKSGGGRSFGYEVVTGVDDSGRQLTGERRIHSAESEVVREIFRRFAAGEGPRAIARLLNSRNVPGPHGRPWGDTTIRGHAKKGTGILNNELYRGRQVWGRQRFIKDPITGRRVARLNPAGSEIATNVAHLRIDWKEINPDIFGSMIQAVADDDERGSLGMHYTRDPIANGLLVHAEEPRGFFDGVAAVDFREPRVEAPAGHGSPRAFLDQLADVLHAPRGNARTELYGLWEAAGFDPGPPRRLADGNGASRGKDG